jgi:TnpA family transposase
LSIRAILSVEQRNRLFAIPVERAEMARHYVLAPDDLMLIGAKRRAPNRLGFAIQLCLLRYPGQVLGQANTRRSRWSGLSPNNSG